MMVTKSAHKLKIPVHNGRFEDRTEYAVPNDRKDLHSDLGVSYIQLFKKYTDETGLRFSLRLNSDCRQVVPNSCGILE